MSVRTLFASLLLAVLVVHAAPAGAKSKHAKAKIGFAAKKKRKKPKRRSATPAPTPRPSDPPPAPPAVAAPCANTGLVADAGNLELVSAALVCLHNQVRAQYGLGALSENGALAAAAAGHSADMIGRGYFDHATPEGATFVERILAAHYANAGDGWTLGENLAWGTDELSTAAGLMRSWMESPGHRENILKPAYRELGLGLELGTPTGDSPGLTVSAEFGARVI